MDPSRILHYDNVSTYSRLGCHINCSHDVTRLLDRVDICCQDLRRSHRRHWLDEDVV